MNKEFKLTNEILDNINDGIIIYSPSGDILWCNRTAALNYELSSTVLQTYNCDSLLDDGVINQTFTRLSISTGKPITFEQRSHSGKRFINKTLPVLNDKSEVIYIIEQIYSVDSILFVSNEDASKDTVLNKAPVLKEPQQSYSYVKDFKSPAMKQVYQLADNMSPKNINILLLGSSGTEKTRFAKYIHDNSTRKNGPFITINCATIPANLIESELFGYTKGAFSGANSNGKQGLVELSNTGTLFLDEIGELPLDIQSKMLQLIQEKTYLPIGGVKPQSVDSRIIAATNKNLPQLISDGKFREDLYYRLAVVSINIPSLKNRTEDIPNLIHHFINVFNVKHDSDVSFAENTIALLCNYSWPGNIRELEHLIEFLILNAKDEYVTPYMLPSNISGNHEIITGCTVKSDNQPLQDKNYDKFSTLNDFIEFQESNFINSLYNEFNNSYKLADRLDISQSKASRLIRKYIK